MVMAISKLKSIDTANNPVFQLLNAGADAKQAVRLSPLFYPSDVFQSHYPLRLQGQVFFVSNICIPTRDW
jgi:hypothetical protein